MSTPFVVMKFGGTSVASAERWLTIKHLAQQRCSEGEHPVIVCSAISGVSNLLDTLGQAALERMHVDVLNAIKVLHLDLMNALGLDHSWLEEAMGPLRQLSEGIALVGEISPRVKARIMSAGELLSTRIGHQYLARHNLDSQRLDIRDYLTTQDGSGASHWLSGICSDEYDAKLVTALKRSAITITQGFIARSPQGDTVLLGRGGSDTSAAVISARIDAIRCEIWTDVPGVYTANPKETPEARLIKALDYDEAQEIASAGAAVLHPRCIEPVKKKQIPLHIRCTPRPQAMHTVISAHAPETAAVKVISARRDIGLVSMTTLGMWQQSGFLADVFTCFKQHGFSVDLVSTSETNVTASIDPAKHFKSEQDIVHLCKALEVFCHVQYIPDCVAISLVGRQIRAIIHRLGPAFEVFESEKILLISQAASDLNLTFVVEASQADRLVQKLHVLLFGDHEDGAHLGPRWRETFEQVELVPRETWWRSRAAELINLNIQEATYVYALDVVAQRAKDLAALKHVDRVFFAMKANDHPEILRTVEREGIGFEAVSRGELEHLFATLPQLDRQRVLFTPNFASQTDYHFAVDAGVWINIDNVEVLKNWGETFNGADILLRVDPGQGRGHHVHVHTGGKRSKFGITRTEVAESVALAEAANARVVGLHAHVGSGVRDPQAWVSTATLLSGLAQSIPTVKLINIGGGLGVVEKPTESPLDLDGFDASLESIKVASPNLDIWIEPGRYLVAEAGVLLTRVTQRKRKVDRRYLGVNAGMNALIRPALYGAWHEIVNLSRLNEVGAERVTIVGPICETGDTLGYDRLLPISHENDLILIATAGAYGRVMSSNYNRRAFPIETILPLGDSKK